MNSLGRRTGPGGCLGALSSLGRLLPSGLPGISEPVTGVIPPATTTQFVTVNLNAADAVGAFRMIVLVLGNTTGPLATPAGWTRVGTIKSAGTAHSHAVYYRFKVGGDADSVQFEVSNGVTSVAYGGSYSSRTGVSTSWPVQDDQSVTFAASTAPDLPAATVGTKKSVLVGIVSADTAATYTPPSGFTERVDSSGTGLSLEVVDRAYSQTGSQNPAAGVASASLANGIARSIILNPAVVADTTAPTVSLASSSTSVTTASTITLTATASDDQGIKEVRFYRNAVLIGTDTASPFTQDQALTSADNGTISYTAVAEDLAGNTTTSNAVSVTVNIPASATYVASTTQEGGASVPTLAVPAGTQDGDILIAAFAFNNLGGEVALTGGTPSGWTEIAKAAWGAQFQAYYRTAGASEPASYSFHAACDWRGFMLAYRNADALAPVLIGTEAAGNDTAPTAATLTTDAADSLLVALYDIFTDATYTAPAGMTERVDYPHNVSGGFMSMAAFDEPVAVAGATGTRAATTSAAEKWHAFNVAIRKLNTTTVELPASGKLGQWPFNDGSGTTLSDTSGNARHGTFGASAPTWATGGLAFVPEQFVSLSAHAASLSLGDTDQTFIIVAALNPADTGERILWHFGTSSLLIETMSGVVGVGRQGTHNVGVHTGGVAFTANTPHILVAQYRAVDDMVRMRRPGAGLASNWVAVTAPPTTAVAKFGAWEAAGYACAFTGYYAAQYNRLLTEIEIAGAVEYVKQQVEARGVTVTP